MRNTECGPEKGIMASLKSSHYYYNLNLQFEKEATIKGTGYDKWGFDGHVVLAVGSRLIRDKYFFKNIAQKMNCIYVPSDAPGRNGCWNDVKDLSELLKTNSGSRSYEYARKALSNFLEGRFKETISSFSFLMRNAQIILFNRAIVPENRLNDLEGLIGKLVLELTNGCAFLERE